jgi:hypothetical protein
MTTLEKVLIAGIVILAFIIASSVVRAENPPPRYDSGPSIYGPTKIVRLSERATIKRCAYWSRTKPERYGCTFCYKTGCIIYISTNLPSGWYPGVLRHELAHTRGWTHRH